jgi:hypothetical protein
MPASERRPTAPSIRQEGIPAAARRRAGSPRQALAACIAGATILAALAPPDLMELTERLGDGQAARTARAAAGLWERSEAALGLAEPHRALRRAAQRLLSAQWPQITG